MARLEGKVAVVLGASGGLGSAITRRFAAEGASLVLAARNLDKLAPLAAEFGGLAVTCDITRNADVEGLARTALAERGALDVVVNAAGFEGQARLSDLGPDLLEPMVAVQFTGAVYFLRHMANAMTRGGSIITTSSLTGTLVAEGYAAYAGAKAGINHVTRIAAAEYGSRGVRVNCVAPSLIETPMTQRIFQLPGVTPAFLEETPLGRMGTIDDVAEAVLWLASDASSYITGQNLIVDGGTSLRRLPTMEQFLRHARAASEKA